MSRGAPPRALASRGEIWIAELDPVRGREQAGTRPVLIVSTDDFNHGPARLVVAVPLTTRDRRVPLRVQIDPPDGGVKERSFAICESARSISTSRLVANWGTVAPRTLDRVRDSLRILLDL
jgi:mRNA interferase MazF